MNPELRKAIWAEMQAVGDRLRGILPADLRHPTGRNPHAHVAGCVKDRFGCSYRDLPDEKADELRDYLKKLEETERRNVAG
ncbi:MAG: hypothetical protein ACKODZ_07080 [Verrucomicrobiota bacterium]